jgi:MinD-like ATPase involved in chromosome partitioning or flagellar assembly
MIAPVNGRQRGIVYTFYSFKGGVGRTMALANVAALFAKWGHSVLVVDWDLEASGLERFFARRNPGIQDERAKKPGILDLVEAAGNGEKLSWRDCLLDLTVDANSSRLSMLTAGRNDANYASRLQTLDFAELFEKHDLGAYIEQLRNEWTSEFEFVLVDSRTGVTDIGGICTVHLADVLVLLFTTTESSVEGAIEIVERARQAQQRLPLDRKRLLAVPVPARDESRTEYERAAQWKKRFAERFSELYRDWLPSGKTAHDAIELLRIPYIPYWSFGEELPVIEEGTTEPGGLGFAYETLSRVLLKRLDWSAALEGQTLVSRPSPSRRELDINWLERHREAALHRLSIAGFDGFMEIYHFSPDSLIERSQPELLAVATQAQVRRHGWPTGVVRDEFRPMPVSDGIIADITRDFAFAPGHLFAYWSLTKQGDFYTLMSLSEDHREQDRARKIINSGTRIVRAAEVLQHCANLYDLLGAGPNASIELTARYGGLQERTLETTSQYWLVGVLQNFYESEIRIPAITFRLGAIETDLMGLVKKLCEPLFVVFDYATFPDAVYQEIVTDFVRGKAIV